MTPAALAIIQKRSCHAGVSQYNSDFFFDSASIDPSTSLKMTRIKIAHIYRIKIITFYFDTLNEIETYRVYVTSN